VAALHGDSADLSDLYAGDRHGLTLARGDRRGIRELGVDRVVALAERERRLVGQDVVADHDREREDRQQRDDVATVPSDRAPHGVPPVLAEFRLGAGLR
jgi:hypothetical protein